VKHFKAFLKTF